MRAALWSRFARVWAMDGLKSFPSTDCCILWKTLTRTEGARKSLGGQAQARRVGGAVCGPADRKPFGDVRD